MFSNECHHSSKPAKAEKASSDKSNQTTVKILETEKGVRFGIWAEQPERPAPTLFIFTGTIQSLDNAYFRQCGNILAEQGWLCVSLDIPSHGLEKIPEEPLGMAGWRHRVDHGYVNFIAEFNAKISNVLDYLIAKGYTNPENVAVCGTSRGGFIALHFAAAEPRIKCVAAFAPVTDLEVLKEFQNTKNLKGIRSLSIINQAGKLAVLPVWVAIGDKDERVGTDRAIAFAQKVSEISAEKKLNTKIQLHVVPADGHTTPDGAPEKAAAWITDQMNPKKH